MIPLSRALLLVFLLGLPAHVLGLGETTPVEKAQQPTQAGRSTQKWLETPLSVSQVERTEILPGRPAIELDEALQLVPGVFAQSSRNFAQDTRVSIRGFGSRASFGIRGVRVLIDGIPTTLPDGQSEVDSIDLAFVDRIEVIRSPVSSLHGGGAGGVLSFTTLKPTENPEASLRSVFGTHNLWRHEGITTGTFKDTGYTVGLTSTQIGGYRDHSRARHDVLLTKLERQLGDSTQVLAQFGSVWAPRADDPGGLTAGEVAASRDSANPRSLLFDAGEELDQQRVGIRVQHEFSPGHEIQLIGYHVWRDFENKLPFNRQVEFDRHVGGGSLVMTNRWGAMTWSTGVDVDIQSDERLNFENLSGVRGDRSLDQSEDVRSVGPFVQVDMDLGHGFGLIGGLRYDWSEFKVDDQHMDDGDQSDRLHFRELSPRVGLRYGHSDAFHGYANYTTAFHVPTTTELRPLDGMGGFDSDLDPERTQGFEIGAKGLLAERLLYDVALFDLRVRNAIIPFSDARDPNSTDTFFRNAGEVRRRGIELGASAQLAAGVSLRTAYTYAHYEYADFDQLTLLPGGGSRSTSLDGNWEPNTPRHHLSAELRIERPSGWFGALSLRHFSDIEVNDENTMESSGATLSDLRMGYRFQRGHASITPVFGARNWSGVDYDGSLRPNAGGGRYFEPAPETELYVALEVRYGPRGDPLTR